MYATSPPESVHALDVNALKASNITFFSGWKQQQLAGCVAIKTLDANCAELKSMRTAKQFRGTGVASQLLLFALEHAKMKGFSSVSLETGTQEYFLAARTLYKKFGFVECKTTDKKMKINYYKKVIKLELKNSDWKKISKKFENLFNK